MATTSDTDKAPTSDTQKANQIAHRIYTKLWQVVENGRIPDEPGLARTKTDKWFNLETQITSTVPTAALDVYRTLSAGQTKPMAIQVVLVVPPSVAGWALMHEGTTTTRVEPEPRFVLLEEWVLSYVPLESVSSGSSTSSMEDPDIQPSTIYKNTIPLFRALYSFLRILPAWRTVVRLARRRGNGRSLRVAVRLRPDNDNESMLRFGQRPGPTAAPLPTSTHTFPAIAHPAGTLSLSTTYLTTPSFTLQSLEALLSSRFADLDARPRSNSPSYMPSPTSGATRMPLGARPAPGAGAGADFDAADDDDNEGFVPTLARRSISISSTSFSPSSPSRHGHASPLPIPGTSASPGRYTSVLQSRQRTESTHRPTGSDPASTSTSYSRRIQMPIPAATDIDRFVLQAGAASTGAAGTSASPPSSSFELGRGLPSEREREREREKGVPIGSGGGGGGGLSSLATGLGMGSVPGSAPSPTMAINPFKSNTLSRSSLTGSLLRGVSGSPGRAGIAFPQPPGTPSQEPPPPSSSGVGMGLPGSASSSSGVGVPVPGQQRKRYSSSFSHRYGAQPGSSVGSGGSGESGSQSGGPGSHGSFGVGAAALRDREGERERRESAGAASGSGSRSGSFLKSVDPQQQPGAQQDDISAFVKDLDSAPPLLGRYRDRPAPEDEDDGDDDENENEQGPPTSSISSSPSTSTASRGGTIRGSGSTAHPSRASTLGISTSGSTSSAVAPNPESPSTTLPMPTTISEMDEQLKRMNEQFNRTLAGFGSRGGRSGSGPGGSQRSPVGAVFAQSSQQPSQPGSASSSGYGALGFASQGSDEVIGRMDFDSSVLERELDYLSVHTVWLEDFLGWSVDLSVAAAIQAPQAALVSAFGFPFISFQIRKFACASKPGWPARFIKARTDPDALIRAHLAFPIVLPFRSPLEHHYPAHTLLVVNDALFAHLRAFHLRLRYRGVCCSCSRSGARIDFAVRCLGQCRARRRSGAPTKRRRAIRPRRSRRGRRRRRERDRRGARLPTIFLHLETRSRRTDSIVAASTHHSHLLRVPSTPLHRAPAAFVAPLQLYP
uniref:Autophagy-related protein 13 n=1 Tax=Mycena chlorophos TaxID=658473 RepID=A0ABQ0L9E4_MYCCL|nr:predicted protein [Mycena chlorophos]